MREAMAAAPVGDDVYGEDPTVNRLQEMAAEMLGKETALFVPSGIMANQLSLRVHARPGEEAIVDARAHLVRYEHGAAAAINGVQLLGLAGARGLLSPQQIEAAIRPTDPYNPRTAVICLENTHNSGGGTVYPLATIEQIRRVAVEHEIPMHLDGARLFNAVIASGVPVAEYARHFETVSFCLSKGLGAPVGSLIVSTRSRIDAMRRWRRMLGGGMRQAGILAAAGVYALEHHIPRLAEDHRNAQHLAAHLKAIPTVSLDSSSVQTNIVIFDVAHPTRSAEMLVQALREHGVLISALGGRTFRAVTHLDVTASDIERAGTILAAILSP